MGIIYTFGIIGALLWPTGNWYWLPGIIHGMDVTLIFFAIYLGRKVHWSIVPAFLIFSLNPIHYTFTLDNNFYNFGPFAKNLFAYTAAESFCFLMGITLPLFVLEKKHIRHWINGFGLVIFCSSLMMIYHWFTLLPFHITAGLISNPALDATFVALVWPSMALRPIERFKKLNLDISYYPFSKYLFFIYISVPIVAVLLSKSNTAIALIGGEFILYFILQNGFKFSLRFFLTIGFIVLATRELGRIFLGDKLYADMGRFGVWKISLDYWILIKRYWFGVGSGTYILLGPLSQKAKGYVEAFFWAHNEFLQVLFEQGIFGLISLIIVFCFMVKNTIRNELKWLPITVIAIPFACITQPIFRLFQIALFCTFICRICFMKNIDEEPTI